MTFSTHLRRNLIRAGILLLVLVVAWSGWQVVRVWRAWSSVERIPFDVAEARQALSQLSGPGVPDPFPVDGDDAPGTLPPDITIPTSPRLADGALQSFLIIGSDYRPERGASTRADVILLFLRPADGSDPVLVSLPRDLYLPNPCTPGSYTRINAALNGCGAAVTGPELLAIAVEDFTGVQIDHFAVFDFEGFKAVIDRVGGVRICVDRPVRDTKSELALPAGCTMGDGATTLAWVRSRKTWEQVDGVWRPMPGVNDLTRNQRQQELLLEALRRLKSFRSITELSALVEDLADAFAIDAGLSLRDAVDVAWDMRSVAVDDIKRPSIPVADYVTAGGAYVLLPRASFAEVLESAYPGAASILAEG
ncbi:MAG: LytR family transcriptional regulator [Actinobacteria bacterium]|nr:LytR family transcriptional regulator [Actinomycetota bacterium]